MSSTRPASVLLLLLAISPPVSAAPLEETLPPLVDGKAPQTVEQLWSGFDPRREALDVEVLREWEEDGVVMRVVRYRIGIFRGQKAMMAAVHGFPVGGTKLPGLVQIHGGGQYAHHNAVLTNARRGYATISIAWAGRIDAPGYRVTPAEVKLFWEGRTDDPDYRPTTDWGALDGYHAPGRNAGNQFPSARAAAWTLDPVESPRNSGWFLCTLGARRALTFLERQPEVDADRLGVYGHSMGGKLTILTAGSDHRVKAAAPSCGGISDRDNASPLFRATLGDDVYLPRVSCPVVFLSPANDFHGHLGDLQSAVTEIRSPEWRVTCSPHHNHQDTPGYEVATQLWFDQHLKGIFRWPQTPRTELNLRTPDGVPVLTVRPDDEAAALAIDVFYTQQGREDGDRNARVSRFWRHAAAIEKDGVWTASLPVFSTDAPLWVYSNVWYALDAPITGAGYYYRSYTTGEFNVSSRMHRVSAQELQVAGVRATLRPSLVIERFAVGWEKEWFTYRPEDWARRTHKVHDPQWAAPAGAKLAFEVRAAQANTLVVGLDAFAAELRVEGKNEWQDVVLSPVDFTDAAGDPAVDWSGLEELRLGAEDRLRARKSGQDHTRKLGARWSGAPPEFRNLRWRVEPATARMRPATAIERMPLVGDYTSMWWWKGFPGTVPGAPWRRCIQSGTYAMMLDTESLTIPHLGSLPPGTSFNASGHGDENLWASLEPAELELSLNVNGRRYRHAGGGKWSRFEGPRLVESGRFVQRADVTALKFASAEGVELNVEARFETVAWPHRLAFVLAARPSASAGSARGEAWRDAILEIRLSTRGGEWERQRKISTDGLRDPSAWHEVALAFDPASAREAPDESPVVVQASELPRAERRPVRHDAARGWHRIDLDGIRPIVPPGDAFGPNDAIERIQLVLSNPTAEPQMARLLFAKERGGIRQRIGSPITGISAMLRDADGNPTGIPVQISKNWHTRPEGGVHSGQWFHGFSLIRLPARATVELELTLSYGHWGGVPAASHAQLCLIGWGSNQHWSQSALGAWGESLCFEPDQVQARCTITDVRPVLVGSPESGRKWAWTSNVGGGDFFRFFGASGARVPHSAMRALYHRHGPCLTEVTFVGHIGDGIEHSSTVSLGRTDDLVRGVYRLRLDVKRAMEFSRFVVFQIGADTYSYTGERKMAVGNEGDLLKEWETRWGGDTYRTEPMECAGSLPWVSLHEAVPRDNVKNGAWANRGVVVRAWTARLGGKDAKPWVAERGVTIHRQPTSTMDIVPPPGVTRLEPGDFVEATFEHIVVPQRASEYHGPNADLRTALEHDANTWRMIAREAVGDRREVEVTRGALERRFPEVRVRTEADRANFALTGGLGHVPVTFTGLTTPTGHRLFVNGEPVDQSVHGEDFWQTDYNPATRRWAQTYNIQVSGDRPHTIEFRPATAR